MPHFLTLQDLDILADLLCYFLPIQSELLGYILPCIVVGFHFPYFFYTLAGKLGQGPDQVEVATIAHLFRLGMEYFRHRPANLVLINSEIIQYLR